MAKTETIEDEKFNELLELLKDSPQKIDKSRIKRAYEYAKRAHDGQFRMSGIPYICHPVDATKTLVSLGADEDTIVAGLLHDVPEDTARTVKDIGKAFGKDVQNLVDALTKLSKVYYRYSMTNRQVNSLRKMFLETAHDPRVVVIKLADRLHNMTTLQYLRPDKQQRIAKETLEIYAPLANLYGIYQIRRELEDHCFMYLQPEEYGRIKAFVHDHEKKRDHFVNDSIRVIEKALKKAKVSAQIEGRPKHYYSIYQKMVRDNKMLKDIYDYFAIRIITDDKENCYKILGIVHELFKPKPQRFKDYIALPKPNGYQSLHTTVIGLRGKLTEIQIRSEQMHQDAEFGVAAHVYYKNGQNRFLADSIAQLKKFKEPEQFIQGLQDDLLQSRIFVFSPSGEVINLPEGATCLDYIYKLNLDVKDKAFRVIVNNRTYSLVGELQSGDRVEVIYYGDKDTQGPERWWLGHVKTTKAKKAIREFFEKKSFAAKVKIGEELLQQEFDHENRGPIYRLPENMIRKTLEQYDMQDFEHVLAALGEGALESNQVYRVLFPKIETSALTKVYFWMMSLIKRYRSVEHSNKYRIRIIIEAYDRVGLLREVLGPFYTLGVTILMMKGYTYPLRGKAPKVKLRGEKLAFDPDLISRDVLEVEVESHEELIALFDRIEKIPGMIRVYRQFRRRQFSFFLACLITGLYFVVHPFLLLLISRSSIFKNALLGDIVVYVGLAFVMVLLLWLRSMANKTFPHFEETKYFWPIAFFLTTIAVTSLFVNRVFFGLGLDNWLNAVFAGLIFVFLYFAFRSHERRRARHLKRLRTHTKNAENA